MPDEEIEKRQITRRAVVLNDFRSGKDLSGNFDMRCLVQDGDTGEIIDIAEFIYEME